MKRAILFVLPNAGGGGAERVTITLLRRLDPSRFDLSLLLLDRSGEFLPTVPEHVRILDLEGARARNALWPLIRTIRRETPDIVFSTHGYINILCLTASFFVDSAIAFYVRHPVMPGASSSDDGVPAFQKRLLRLLYPRARRIVAQNSAMREAMTEVFRLPAERIEVRINPVDGDLIRSKVEGRSNPLDPDRVNFVAAGRLTHQKGFDLLLKAFRIVVEREPRARLYILGEGEERARLESQIREYRLSGSVRLEGFQDNPYPFFKFADLFVLSSRYEGLPNAVLESLFLGTPCVGTRCIPFMEEIIQEPDNGALVDVSATESLANKLLNRDAYRIEPRLLDFAGTLQLETLFENTGSV